MDDPSGMTPARREALIAVSLGGVRGIRDGDSEHWRISHAEDKQPPSEADLAWLRQQGLIEIKWLAGHPSSPARLTPKGVEALKAGGAL